MKLDNFQNEINSVIFARGVRCFQAGKVTRIEETEKGFYEAVVSGNYDYDVEIRIGSDNNTVLSYYCDCPYGSFCKHCAAVLFKIRKMKSENRTSSREISFLVQKYNEIRKNAAYESADTEGSVKLIPKIKAKYGNTFYNLYISKEGGREYKITNPAELREMFEENQKKRYGKNLELTHTYSSLDEKSRKLLDLTSELANLYGYDRADISFTAGGFLRLMKIFRDDYISYNDCETLVKYDNPEISFTIAKENEGLFSITLDNSDKFKTLGADSFTCWNDTVKRVLYIASKEYHDNVSYLFFTLVKSGKLLVSKEEAGVFYSSVLRFAERNCVINGIELLDEYRIQDGTAQLYLDVDGEGNITGKLKFLYGDSVFEAFRKRKQERICDVEMEFAAENTVRNYFEIYENSEIPLRITDEDQIYRLCSEGLEKLSSFMEIYASDRFESIKLRTPARPKVGIRPESNLLELDITDDNYTIEELIELLNAYRKGAKYHRLRDGSFADINSGIAELAEMTHALNLSDKAFLKEKISVPAYRMLYLDSLAADTDAMRVKRNSEFKKAVNEFRNMSDDSDRLKAPDELEETMRDYQKYGFRWLKTIEQYGFGGILADDMGLGKTLQAISLMLDAARSSEVHRTNLVVCPASLTLNWENEISRFAPELRTAVVIGAASERSVIISEYEKYDVLITSYSIIARDIAWYDGKNFYMQFIDEAQYIKNHSTQASKAVKAVNSSVKYALTGTPVENSLAELWSIFDYIMPGYLFSYTSFKKNYETPIVRNGDENAVKSLQRVVSPFILRRLKKDVLTELPEKTESVVYSEMTKEQSKLYTANVMNLKKMLGQNLSAEQDKIKILAMLTRLRQICCDPSIAFENYNGGSAKLDLCCELVEECINSGHKILLFSQFTSMIDEIKKRFDENGISCYVLTGATRPKERIDMVNRFNSDGTNVFLISLKAGGTGLNLTGADIVIHYDPWWNVSAENQASDRAYRIGQKRNVQIYKLIARGTIEEKICDLQKNKAELAELAVGGEGNIMHMNSDDILDLLN